MDPTIAHTRAEDPSLRLRIFSLDGPAARADARLSASLPSARDGFARAAQERAMALGLRRGDLPIPLVLSPLALPRAELSALGRAAHLLLSALVKVARDLIERRPARARLLFQHLSPLEQEALQRRWREAEELFLARVDWFVDRLGHPRALEINATIPAMPVYSDAALRGWLSVLCPEESERLFAKCKSNAAWVVDAFFLAARRAGRRFPLSVQLLHRPGDPQFPELVALAELFSARGAEARTCTPADVVLDGAPSRAIYRHLFARYVEPRTPLGEALLDPVRHGVWNRVDGWLEIKGLFAELSEVGTSESLLLSPEERSAVGSLVPWTRLLDDLDDAALGTGEDYVLKRSHDYGGKSVVIGQEVGARAFRTALAAARRDPPGTWIAQDLVDAPAVDRWFAVPAEPVRATRGPLHVDVSTFASLIPGVPEGGSVCRGAPGRVVNIVGGGGVVPLFPEDVLEEALDGL